MKIRDQQKYLRPQLRRAKRLRHLRGIVVARVSDGEVGRLGHHSVNNQPDTWVLFGPEPRVSIVMPWDAFRPAQPADLLQYRLEGGR